MKILLLAGGRSKRMGRDKATIERPDGTAQIDHLISIAQSLSPDTLLSSRDPLPSRDDIKLLPDLHPGSGPLAALEAFHAAHPDEPVLVLGCDLFLLDAASVQHLLDTHESKNTATCFANRIDHRPEPLCAVYSPSALKQAAIAITENKVCARRFLEELNPTVIELPNVVALDNANTPEELEEAFAKLKHGATKKKVHILYFAKLREARGLDEESTDTLACTTGGLYEELRFRHRLPLNLDSLRCARNGDFCEWNTMIEPDDEIVFIPPVAGG